MKSPSEWPQLFWEICDRSSEALMIADADRRILYVNEAFEETTGYRADEIQGRDPSALSSGYHDPDFYARMWRSIRDQGRWQGLIWNRRRDGQIFPEWLTVIRLERDGTTYYAGQFSDLSAIESIRSDLRRFACYDHLTQLPNRALFEDLMANRLRQSARRKTSCALLFIDIDHFKQFNDVYGHGFGDSVIRAVAQRLRELLRDADLIARFAGDEFVVLMDECPDEACLTEVSDRVIQGFAKPLDVEGELRYLSVTVGTARSPEDGNDVESLIRNADIALFAAKDKGRGQAMRFSRELFGPLHRANLVATSLRQELEQGPEAFSVVYQPQFDLVTGQIVGLEALMRWQSPELGSVSPAEFIGIAENHGLIETMTGRLVEQVLRDITHAPAALLKGITLCLNVSALQIPNAALLPVLEPLRAECRALSADVSIELEITETQLVRENEQFPRGLHDLRDAGFAIAIDDFGTGYSALGYLRRLPVDTLKIDRCFVNDLHRNKQDAAIVSAIITMARGLGLKIVAEGIEEPEQQAFLRAQGCTIGQGYLLARPSPLHQALGLEAASA